jgi:hypothetical protein
MAQRFLKDRGKCRYAQARFLPRRSLSFFIGRPSKWGADTFVVSSKFSRCMDRIYSVDAERISSCFIA